MSKGRLNESRALVNLSKAWKDIKAYNPESKDDKKGFDGRFILSDGTPCRYQVKSSMHFCKKFMQHEAWQKLKEFTALLLVQGSEITFVHVPDRMRFELSRLRKFHFFHFNLTGGIQ